MCCVYACYCCNVHEINIVIHPDINIFFKDILRAICNFMFTMNSLGSPNKVFLILYNLLNL